MSTVCFVFRPRRRVNGKLRVAVSYSGKLRMAWETGHPSVIALGTTDRRIAEQILNERARERHLERQGLLAPREAREAANKPLVDLVTLYLETRRANGKREGTIAKYHSNLTILAKACGWQRLRDVSLSSFTRWWKTMDGAPKSRNDKRANALGFLRWAVRQKMLTSNPLEDSERDTRRVERFRRALSEDEQRSLLATAPHFRAVVYLLILETGMRRGEVNRLKVGDFVFDTPAPFVRISADAKNGKPYSARLRASVVEAVRSVLPDYPLPSEWVFLNRVPRLSTFVRDLKRSGIAFETENGRVDLHALRVTFCTNLLKAGVHPRVAQELMRHSDIKLTMKNYTDETQLPVAAALDQLPKITLCNGPEAYTSKHTHGLRPEGLAGSSAVLPGPAKQILQAGT